jgi:hypothetical protein
MDKVRPLAAARAQYSESAKRKFVSNTPMASMTRRRKNTLSLATYGAPPQTKFFNVMERAVLGRES